MDNILMALDQYWSVESEVKLHPENTFFDDVISNAQALRVGIAISGLATAIVISWCLVGVIL